MITVLWDIDGTLMRTPGLGIATFARALEAVTGRAVPRDRTYDFGGKTDPLIARELLAAVDADDDEHVDAMLAEVELAYEALHDQLVATAYALPGTTELLGALAARGEVQTVVTGNLRSVARRKLGAVGLDRYLDLDAGGYGSDHADRAELVRLSMERLRASTEVDPAATWVIGDTPRDAACAAANGVRCLLVATGTYTAERLAECEADAILADLAEVERVLELLVNPPGRASTA